MQQDMPAALVQLIQTEFNESSSQAFTSHLPVRWPHFTPLIRTLTKENFHPGTVTMLGGFRHSLLTTVATYRSAAPHNKTSTTPHQRGESHTATSQVAVKKSAPLPQLQFGLGFRLRKSMEKSEETTCTSVTQTDNGRPFCLSYHLRGVCNSNCGGHHGHRTLSSHEQGVLSA